MDLSSGICNPRVSNADMLPCPRGFVIPEALIVDILSARVTDPQLSPCGLQIHRDNCLHDRLFYRKYVPAFSKKACRKLKMFSVKNEPRPSERSEGVWRV